MFAPAVLILEHMLMAAGAVRSKEEEEEKEKQLKGKEARKKRKALIEAIRLLPPSDREAIFAELIPSVPANHQAPSERPWSELSPLPDDAPVICAQRLRRK